MAILRTTCDVAYVRDGESDQRCWLLEGIVCPCSSYWIEGRSQFAVEILFHRLFLEDPSASPIRRVLCHQGADDLVEVASLDRKRATRYLDCRSRPVVIGIGEVAAEERRIYRSRPAKRVERN